jgi:hypothetical protein
MVGFIKGLFGAKQAAKTESTPPPEAAPKLPKPRPQAFYLDSSDAKTLGDIDYMQAAREIKRSFPKTLNGEVPRTISIVSSMQRSQAQKEQAIALQRSQATIKAATFSAPSSSGWATPKADNAPKIKDPKERRRQDSSLDTFRSMARDLQKNNNRSY